MEIQIEEEIERHILYFVQNIVNGHARRTTEYLKFIYSDTVNVEDLLSVLNGVRLIQKLYSSASDIINSRGIKQTSDRYSSMTKDAIIKYINKSKCDVNDVLKKIQKAYNESLDIDDEEEYRRVQSEVRERRKKFRLYNEFLTSCFDSVVSYVNVSVNSTSTVALNKEDELSEPFSDKNGKSLITQTTITEPVSKLSPNPENERVLPEKIQLTEQMFFDWLVSEGGVSYTTAKQYISNVHSIEKLYQNLYGDRRNILGADSVDNVKEMIETLVQRNEYIDANERRHNSFSAALNKFAQFTGFSIDKSEITSNQRVIQTPFHQDTYTVKTVDFYTPQNCTYYKPYSFIFNKIKYSVGSWRELYSRFLILLYTDNAYTEILKGLIGKSLYGHRIDFADKILSHYLRKPIKVSSDFFAEGNFSASDIIKRIKCLMELCSINDSQMVIEYITHDKNDEIISVDNADSYVSDDFEQLSMSVVTDNVIDETVNEELISSVRSVDNNEVLVEQQADEQPADSVHFIPDNTKPFVLKNAVIEILSSDATETAKYREHKDGISSKNLRELLKEYYGKTISLFEISKLLMMDKAFQPVGKGCYILNEVMIPHTAETDYTKPVSQDKEKEETIKPVAETVNTDYTPVYYDEHTAGIAETHIEELTIESILDVIKENSDKLQYKDGFGTYEVKNLLSRKGIANASEKQIEALMSECSELQQVEEGYYSLVEDKNSGKLLPEQPLLMNDKVENEIADTIKIDSNSQKSQIANTESRHIVLRLNGNAVRAYDYSDALNKVCEFSINCKPFRMARIAGQGITIHGNSAFYRKAVPVDGYNKLSNGLQIITINSLADLQTLTKEVQKYCQIDDNMITVICQ